LANYAGDVHINTSGFHLNPPRVSIFIQIEVTGPNFLKFSFIGYHKSPLGGCLSVTFWWT